MLKKALKRQEFRFLVVGASNTLWGILSYPLYFWILSQFSLNYIVVLLVTYLINGTISFTTQKYLVFQTKGNHFKEFSKFFSLQLMILGINLVFLPVCVEVFSLNPVISQTIFVVGVIISSYFFHKYITFSQKKPKQ